MKVNFYATLREIVGGKTVELPTDGNITVRRLLEMLFERYPRLRRELVNEQGELYPHVHIFVNGRDAPYLDDGLDALLSAQDVINIFPAVGGG